jgi:hypothetical protein
VKTGSKAFPSWLQLASIPQIWIPPFGSTMNCQNLSRFPETSVLRMNETCSFCWRDAGLGPLSFYLEPQQGRSITPRKSELTLWWMLFNAGNQTSTQSWWPRKWSTEKVNQGDVRLDRLDMSLVTKQRQGSPTCRETQGQTDSCD